MSDEVPVANAPPERLTDERWAAREAAPHTGPGFGLLPSPPLTHSGSELSDKPHDRTTISLGRSISPLDLLLAAVAQDGGIATASRTDSEDGPFGPRGNPELMVGAPMQPGAGESTGQSPGVENGASRWQETTYSMLETRYGEEDDSMWEDFVEFDCPPKTT